jgi:positive phototaxis protein PixI
MFTQMFVSSSVTDFDPLTLDFLTEEPLPPESGERLLRFLLGLEDSALLPLDQIVEIIRVNVAEILPVPEMPSCVLGICNWRGTMLWLIDLNNLVGYRSLSQQGQVLTTPVAMVIQLDNQTVGLVVQQAYDIELHELQQLQPAAPGILPPKLLPFVLGVLPGDSGPVLDVTAIIQCPLWQVRRRRVS